MFPILIEAGEYTLHSFGLFVALGFIAGIFWTLRAARRAGLPHDRVLDLCFWIMASGLLGARLLYVAVNWRSLLGFAAAEVEAGGWLAGLGAVLVESVAIWEGGLVWYGGLLTAFAVAWIHMRRSGLPVWKTADTVAPGVMLGLAIGRIGCLAAGDDYGAVVESSWQALVDGGDPAWWTLTFTHPQSLVPAELLGRPLYPTQPLMSLNALLVFGVLVLLQRRKPFDGAVVWTMMALYAVGRFGVEFMRGDTGRGFLLDGVLSTSQAIGIVAFAVSLYMLRRLSRVRSVAAPAPAPEAI